MKGFHKNQRGFTLPELMIVIVLLGILAAIAIPSWFGLVASREVTSATNQVAADLRLAHGTARNRLMSVRVQIDTTKKCSGEATASGRWYKVVEGAQTKERCLPEGSKFITSVPAASVSAVEFKPDGTAQLTGSGDVGIARKSDNTPEYRIEINTQTSRVKVV